MNKEEIIADLRLKLTGNIPSNTFVSIEDHPSDNTKVTSYKTSFDEVNIILKQLNRNSYTLISRDVNHLETCEFNYIWLKIVA
jgi:hypothetical protein